MSGVAQEPVVISFTTTNGTAGVTDFTAQSTVSYTIPAGLTSVNIPVTILGDLISEPSETFTGAIAIVNANGQQITIGTGTANGNIADDDVYTISLAGIDVTETNADVAHDFVATMSGVAQEPVVISFTTTNGTAGATDFTAQSTVSYTIPAGSTSVNIPVTILVT